MEGFWHGMAFAVVPLAMTDYLTDTPSLARMYCPGCEPSADPSFEILDVRWCASHVPPGRGLDDDAVVTATAWISGSTEAGGEDNRRWCELFHRARR
jgi:hypothetical protein